MTVLAYETLTSFLDPSFRRGFRLFTGQIDLPFADIAEISVGDEIYKEIATMPPINSENWGYFYIWKAYIFQSTGTVDLLSTFASIPGRYKLGHITIGTVSGIVYDDVLKFEDQVTPLFRGSFYADNPQPGDGFPFGTIPLGESAISVWAADGGTIPALGYSLSRATFLNVFVPRPVDYLVRITYTCQFAFDEFNIFGVAPKPYVQVLP